MSTPHTDIPEKAALLAAETFHFNDPDERLPWSMLSEKARAARIQRAQAALSAALPVVLAPWQRSALVSGDVPITERTPHGVWIADGMDPEPSYAVPCGGPSGCDDCRAYDDLRQHLVEQIIALDEQHQREMKALTASRDSETAELRAENERLRAKLDEAYQHIGEQALIDMEEPIPPYGSPERDARVKALRGEQGE